MVVDDAKAMTRELENLLENNNIPTYFVIAETIFDAVERSGVRAIVSAGWGGLGGTDIPSSVFILPGHPGVPHDWLFKHVSAVCHRTLHFTLLPLPSILITVSDCSRWWSRNHCHWPLPRLPHYHCTIFRRSAILGCDGAQGRRRS